MSQSDRAIKKFATQLARLDREVKSWRGAQADFTSIENGGNFTFKDGDGNVTAIMGGQDDGSNTIRHVDGPTPPVPSGLSAHVDGPIVQVSWDGTFESNVTHDWHYLEVLAVGPNDERLTGTINDLSGGETSLAATSQGDWVITARSVSRAGKRSLGGDAGTASVQLVGLTGAIDAVQESANGKNTIYYSPTEPVAPEGGFNNGDLWFDTSEEGNNTASVWDGNGWVSMEDARLATIIAAQEALEADLQDVQTSVDGKNKITYDPALPPASYVGAVGDTWYRTSGNSMIGFWKWDGAAWVQQALDVTVIPQIDIGAGTFGALKGTRLEAGSVTTDKLLVGDFSNLVDDPALIGPGWSGNVSYSFVYTLQGPGNALFYSGVDGGHVQNGNMFPTMPGTKYVVTARVQNRRTEWVKIHVNWFQHDKTPSAVSESDGVTYATTAPSAVWADVEAQVVAPSDARFGVLRVTYHSGGGAAYVIRPVVRRMTGATLIENGAITTDKLAVGAITAESGVIASLDLGKATVGELDGIRIMGQTIRGEQLSGDAIDGKVITGGTYRTTDGTGQWSDDGLFIAQPGGTSMVRFPTDGSPLSLTASDTQIERASIGDLDLSYGAVRSGGEFTLASGVTPPASPPELTTGWQKVCTLDTPDSELTYDWLGLGYWSEGSGHWVRAVNVLGSEGDGYDRIEVYDYATGDFQKSISITLNPRAGVTVIGDVAYVLGPNHEVNSFYPQYVDGYSLVTGEKVSWFGYERFATNAGGRLAIGNDGTNLVVAGITKSNNLYVMRYDPTTGAQVGGEPNPPSDPLGGDWMATGWTGGRDLLGVSISGSEVTIHPLQETRVYTASGSTLTRKLDSANANGFAGWVNPNRNGAGMVMRVGRFGAIVPFAVDGTGAVYEGSQFTSDTPVAASFTWFDGTNETTPSPEVSGFFSARESPAFSVPTRAGLQKRLYFKFETGDWNRVTLPETLTVLSWMDALNYTPVPAAPPTTNSFPNADPATLKSTNDKFEVKGDGSGKWGPLTFNADGSMSGIRKTASGTLDITPTAANTPREVWVTFPAGRFTATPTVVVSARSSVPGTQVTGVGSGGQTAAGFYAYLTRTNTSTTGFNWIATEEG